MHFITCSQSALFNMKICYKMYFLIKNTQYKNTHFGNVFLLKCIFVISFSVKVDSSNIVFLVKITFKNLFSYQKVLCNMLFYYNMFSYQKVIGKTCYTKLFIGKQVIKYSCS